MSLRAIAFAVALIMLVAGIVGSRPIVNAIGYVLGRHALHATREIPRSTAAPRVRSAASAGTTPTEPREQPRSRPSPTAPSVAVHATHAITPGVRSQVPVGSHQGSSTDGSPGVAPRVALRPTPGVALPPMPAPTVVPTITAIPALLPTPTATPGSSSVVLINYWVASVRAHRGQTVSLVYVIRNDTGTTARVWLGASIKRPSVLRWTSTAISDPRHDIVVVVPPGTSVQVRHFTLARTLRLGSYDVAWGVRDPDSGQRVTLVAAPHMLRVLG